MRLAFLCCLTLLLGCYSSRTLEAPPTMIRAHLDTPKVPGFKQLSLYILGTKTSLQVLSFRGHEETSALYEYHIQCASPSPLSHLEKMMGQELSLIALREDSITQALHGFITKIETTPTQEDQPLYTFVLSPWVEKLRKTSGFSLFQNKTIPDMVESVLARHAYEDYEMHLHHTYPVEPLFLQYRETDWNFICRVLEHVGIHFFFRQENERTVLVMTDTLLPVPQEQVVFTEPMSHTLATTVTRYTLKDFNPLQPGNDSLLGQAVGASTEEQPFEMFDYPGGFRNDEEGNWLSRIRLQELQSKGDEWKGRTTQGLLHAGNWVQEEGADASSLRYVKEAQVDIVYEMEDTLFECRNTFRALPSTTPFRPERRTPWPILGAQPATVLGAKKGQPLRDTLGRVEVRFHWEKNLSSQPVWIPVSHTLVTNGGKEVPLQAGDEVMVTFLDGEIYKPLITGLLRSSAR